ncbi:uncharacterized protein LOC143368061 [Andrena cerasifolii]|uniref:uncharacterized protein LOC143368061 n=1 Tax=Andrena cerasifolii TaxID=2819439 RepID=UPI0040380EA9
MSTNESTKLKTFLSVKQKIDIFKKLESGASVKTLSSKYKVSSTTIRRIRREGRVLENFGNQGTHMLKRRNRRKPTYADIDNRLYEWFLERGALGDRLTDVLLQKKAREICIDFGAPSSFTASRGWLTKFKERHNIRLIRTYGETGSTAREGAEKFLSRLEVAENIYDDYVSEEDEEAQAGDTEVDEYPEENMEIQEGTEEKRDKEGIEGREEEEIEEKREEEEIGEKRGEEKIGEKREVEEIKEEKEEEEIEEAGEEEPQEPRLSMVDKKKRDLNTFEEIIKTYADNDRSLILMGQLLKQILEEKKTPEG